MQKKFSEKIELFQRENFSWIEKDLNFVFCEQYGSEIFVLGESPGFFENKEKIPFVGKAGQFLRKTLHELNLLHLCYFTNIVHFRPPKNRALNAKEINLMQPFVFEHINLINPSKILLLGKQSFQICKQFNFQNTFSAIHPSFALRFNKKEQFFSEIAKMKL